MEVGKLKNVAIILLVLVNISFAAIIITNNIKSDRIRSDERTGIVTALKNLGVEISEKEIPDDIAFNKYTVTRDTSTEALIAGSLLGKSEPSDLGGNIFLYETAKGRALFRSGGNFDITLIANTLPDSDIIKLLIHEARADSKGIYTCYYNGYPVFDCRFSITSNGKGDTTISGSRLPGTPQDEAVAKTLTVATILLNFVDETTKEGIIIRNISQICKGYVMPDSSSMLELKPVWQIIADSGSYYMDATDGTIIKDLK